VLLLTQPTALPSETYAALNANRAKVVYAEIYGGPVTVSEGSKRPSRRRLAGSPSLVFPSDPARSPDTRPGRIRFAFDRDPIAVRRPKSTVHSLSRKPHRFRDTRAAVRVVFG